MSRKVSLWLIGSPPGAQKWLGEIGQVDKWKFCLRTARTP